MKTGSEFVRARIHLLTTRSQQTARRGMHAKCPQQGLHDSPLSHPVVRQSVRGSHVQVLLLNVPARQGRPPMRPEPGHDGVHETPVSGHEVPQSPSLATVVPAKLAWHSLV